jgi:UDP-glucose 4-epimerase
METAALRFSNVYGPYSLHKDNAIPNFIRRCLRGDRLEIFGDGSQTRDFTYVEETAQYLAALMTTPAAAGGTFNICRGEEVAIRDVAQQVAKLVGLKSAPVFLPPRPQDVLRLLGDPSRLKRLLGRSPAIDIAEGLGPTVDWYRRNVKITEPVLAAMRPENWAEAPAESWIRR